jgi:signal transduction histidine kinase
LSAEDLVGLVTQAGFVLLFLIVLARTLRYPTQSMLDTMAFFGVAASVISIGWAVNYLADGVRPGWAQRLETALLLSMPLLLLRLADDFVGVRGWILWAAHGAFAIGVAGALAFGEAPGMFALFLIAYFILTASYASLRFWLAQHRGSGFARERLRAIAWGALLLALLVVIALPAGALPRYAAVWTSLASLTGLASGVSFFLGFAAPGFLRRASQASDLRRIVSESERALAVPELEAVVHSLETAIAGIIGADWARISLWDEDNRTLHDVTPQPEAAAEQATTLRRALEREASAGNRAAVADFDQPGPGPRRHTLVAVPITLDDRLLGVLSVVGASSLMLATGELQLVRLLAAQVGLVLRNRELIRNLADAAAREETVRLKDEFLSAAAHDLKTPLTALLAQSQLLLRNAIRDQQPVAAVAGLERVTAEAQRMRRLVNDLLDTAQSEHSGLLGDLSSVDLLAIAQEVAREFSSSTHQVRVAGDHVVIEGDPQRLRQVLFNLLDNGIKYTPEGGPIDVRLGRSNQHATLQVIDRGIGVPAADRPYIFERFRRGSNSNDRKFTGLGLGLYLCAEIVRAHGGGISLSSTEGRGTTISVELPIAAPLERNLHAAAHSGS